MAPITMTNVPRATASKRKAVDSTTTTDQSAAKRQKTASAHSRPRKSAKTRGELNTSGLPPRTPGLTLSDVEATNAVHAPVPTTAPIPATSDGSNVTAPPQPTTLQASVAIAASKSTTHLPAPTYNPDACFTHPIPALFTPWPHNFPAPTPRFTHPLPSCPVNWSAISGLTAEHIEAYELRAPWNPSPATFTKVRNTTNFLPPSRRTPSEECVRKRFRKACLAIFKCSGVYFEETALGLEDYGVPKQAELRVLLGGMRVADLPTPTPTPPPPSTATDTDTNTTVSTRTLIHRRPHHNDLPTSVYAGDLVAFRLQTAQDTHPTLRVCDKRLVQNHRILYSYNITIIDNSSIQITSDVPTLPFTTPAFDRWHSAVCFGKTHSFPRREYVCREIGDGEYLLRDYGKPDAESTTLVLMLETYAVSQAMGTKCASSMLRREIVRTLGKPGGAGIGREEEVLMGRYLAVGDPVFDVVARFRCLVG